MIWIDVPGIRQKRIILGHIDKELKNCEDFPGEHPDRIQQNTTQLNVAKIFYFALNNFRRTTNFKSTIDKTLKPKVKIIISSVSFTP